MMGRGNIGGQEYSLQASSNPTNYRAVISMGRAGRPESVLGTAPDINSNNDKLKKARFPLIVVAWSLESVL